MLKPMDPDIVRALLEGQPDALSEEVRREEEVFRNLSCPMCYETGCQKKIRAAKIVIGEDGTPEMLVSPFVSGRALPQGYAHCIHCGTDFDPHSGVISHTEASNIAPVDLDPATRIVAPPSNPHRG
jgi:hypothetical protein